MLLVLLLAVLQPRDGRLEESRIAARINQEIITVEEMQTIYDDNNLGADQAAARRQLLRKEAERRLFLQEAAKNDVTVTKEQLDKVIEKQKLTLGGDPEFENWLKFRGMTYAQFREEQRLQLIVQKVLGLKYHQWQIAPGERATPIHDFVTPKEMREYYDTHQNEFKAPESVSIVRLTLQFRNNEERDEKARLARSILRRIEAGSTFEFETQLHTPTGLKHRLDNLGRENELFPKEIMDQVFVMKDGEISDVLIGRASIHIIKLLRKHEARDEQFEEAQPKIRINLEVKRQQANRRLLLAAMRKRTYYWPPDLFE